MLAQNPLKLWRYLFPKGQVERNEFVMGNVQGDAARSLRRELRLDCGQILPQVTKVEI